ncbi:MAG: double-strand break repair protein AddB [Pseudomonadota bacterium]
MAPDSKTTKRNPRLFTIPSGTPFLDVLADTLLADPTLAGMLGSGQLGKNLSLVDLTILLPTRRAVRGLQDAFLRRGQGRAMLLPSIRPLGDGDEEELLLNQRTRHGNLESLARITGFPSSIEPLERQFRLARMIVALPHSPSGGDMARALSLASDLCAFLDMVETERVDIKGISDIVPDEFAANWQLTIAFLQLITLQWPDELEALGLVDPMRHRNLLLEAEAQILTAHKSEKPIIAAGSTGSIPATAALLEAIARLDNGAVVLPGLDLILDEESFQAAPHSHPQYGMKELLRKFGVTRKDVSLWPGCEISERQEARNRLLSEVMRPAETSDIWRDQLPRLAADAREKSSLSGLFLHEAEHVRAESELIALLMREALETPGKTAALITPDRGLGRRVASELRRWGIEVNDSGGRPLLQSPPMSFLTHVGDMVAEAFAPIELLSCLKHPLAALGGDKLRLRTTMRRLEIACLRGPRPASGIAGLRRALKDADAGISELIDRLEAATQLFSALLSQENASFADLLSAHIACAEALSADLWLKDEGEAASRFLNELLLSASVLGEISTKSYLHVFYELARIPVLRPRFGTHPRLFIWSALEARLQHADRIILGGLNENVWPAEPKIDPWLNRPMRAQLGLEPPERRIGLSAYDFVEGACASEVHLTRALKADGAPTVASRWMLRLQGLVKGIDEEAALKAPQWAGWAAELDAAGEPQPALRPAPTPPLAARPVRFSVTEVDTLIRDPYEIYAKLVLRLTPLDDIDAGISVAERGTIIHKALELFIKAHPETLPPDPYGELIRVGKEAFKEALDRPDVETFWWPRYERITRWFVENETARRLTLQRAYPEVSGKLTIETLERPVELRGRADRIDVKTDGSLEIIDYKTGSAPGKEEMKVGFAPQLPLEAEMALRGAFGKALELETSAMTFLRLTGGKPAGEVRTLSPVDLNENAWDGFIKLLTSYEKVGQPYMSKPRVKFATRFAQYDHLARVKEWSTREGGEE